jgi:hypothetical protein
MIAPVLGVDRRWIPWAKHDKRSLCVLVIPGSAGRHRRKAHLDRLAVRIT